MEDVNYTDLEVAILSFLRVRDNFDKFGANIKSEFFSTVYTRELFETISGYFKSYPESTTASKRNLRLHLKVGGDDRKIIKEILSQLNYRTLNEEQIVAELRRFVQRGIVTTVINTGMAALGEGEPVDVDSLVSDLSAAQDIQIIGEGLYDYGVETESFHSSFSPAGDPIETPFELLDEALHFSPCTGEEWIVVGPPGRGKTQVLLNLAYYAAHKGRQALYITAGDQGRITIQRRLDSIISNIPWMELRDPTRRMRGLLAKRVRENISSTGGKIFLQDWSDSGCSPSQIEALLKHNEDISIVLVDYPDIMRADTYYRERRHELANIFTRLRQMAVKYNKLVWCGSQANRSALDKHKITMADVAEDIQKCWVADGIITFCQSEEERADGMGRFFIAKARRPPRKANEVDILIDENTGRIT